MQLVDMKATQAPRKINWLAIMTVLNIILIVDTLFLLSH